jgi:tetratricopeptide (TPR) repeat protein
VPPENPRIAELRRRVHADPASIAFAQLAEEYRRAGNYEDAVKYCRTGLARHPGYLSARVTLGRALVEVGALDDAAREFEIVLHSASDNLAAIRGIAEIEQRRGNMTAALDYYKRALTLARFDSDLEETTNRIARAIASKPVAPGAPGAPGAPSAPGAPGLLDFDALLESLGAPDAAPPVVMDMLLSKAPSPPPATARIESPATVAPSEIDAFADLERELRAFEGGARPPVPDAAVTPGPPDPEATALLDELEAWMRVLEDERTAVA